MARWSQESFLILLLMAVWNGYWRPINSFTSGAEIIALSVYHNYMFIEPREEHRNVICSQCKLSIRPGYVYLYISNSLRRKQSATMLLIIY